MPHKAYVESQIQAEGVANYDNIFPRGTFTTRVKVIFVVSDGVGLRQDDDRAVKMRASWQSLTVLEGIIQARASYGME